VNNLQKYLDNLAQRRRFGMRPGLDATNNLMVLLDHPEATLAPIHIAGTNGKGSVAAMTEAVLRAAGLPCGRYTSPHLRRFNERIMINGHPIADDALLHAIATFEGALAREGAAHAGEPTFFEAITAIAFEAFRQADLRLVVVETGLGGRLDATNVVTPLTAVITRIGLDHTQWLGNTIAEIAAEKAGIIKPGCPVVCGAMPPEASAVVKSAALKQKCRVIDATTAVSITNVKLGLPGLEANVATESRDLGKVKLSLSGMYQAENLATAIAALEAVEAELGITLPDAAFREGLANVCWPGRFQCVSQDPLIIVDGAHNPDCAVALKESLKRLRLKGPLAMIAGCCDDKDATAFFKILAPLCRRAWGVPTPSPRALPAHAVCQAMGAAGLPATPATLAAALTEAHRWAQDNGGAILICGSLFLAGEALAQLHALPWPDTAAPPDPSELLAPSPATT